MNQPGELPDFRERFAQHASRVERNSGDCANERATELALVVPFIRFLGFDTEDLGEVYPQFDTSPPGGEKATVDFAIFQQSRRVPLPFILVEAKVFNKTSGNQFSQDDVDQLKGYMSATTAAYGLLTDGNRCEWYRKLPRNVVDDRPFLSHLILERTDREIEWLTAISKGGATSDGLTQLAWRLALENGIREWLIAIFDTPGDPTAIIKAAKLDAKRRDNDLVMKAAKAVWHDLRGLEAQPPPGDHESEVNQSDDTASTTSGEADLARSNQPPLKPSGAESSRPGIKVETCDDDSLEIGDGIRLDYGDSNRAWRVDGGEWTIESNAAQLTTAVLDFLLGLDARRNDEWQLAAVHGSVVHSASRPAPSKWYGKLPSFSNLWFKKNVGNKAKVDLLNSVAGRLRLGPTHGSKSGAGHVVEVWLVPGPKRGN